MIRRCSDRYVAALLSIASLSLYVTTLATSVGWTDTGELMAVATTLGIGHPTGYPLLSIVGRTWLLLPLGFRVAVQLNLLCAVFTALSVGILYLFIRSMPGERGRTEGKGGRWPAVVAAGFFATSLTVWQQSSSYEVYALHLLIVVSILTAWSRAVGEQEEDPRTMSRWWFVFALSVGFGFGNHMTTVLLAPALLWHYFVVYGSSRRAWRRLLWMALPALAGSSVYAFLPVRAASRPPLNWGDTSTWEAFWRHVGGAQYQVWMFNGADVMERQFKLFVSGLSSEFMLPVLVVALWGVFVLSRHSKVTAGVMIVLAASTLFYAINYDIHDIGPYFLTVYVVLAVMIAPGLRSLQQRAARSGLAAKAALPILAVVGIAWQIAGNHHAVRASVPVLVETFTRSVLDRVPPNAVVVTGRWDYLYSPALYLQHVEGVRTDVLLIDHSLLRDRSWYVEALRERAPWLDNALSAEFEAFLLELRKFERREPFSLSVIQLRWERLWLGILRASNRSRPVFIDHRLGGEAKGWDLSPDGYLVRLGVPGTSQLNGELPEWIPARGNESPVLDDFEDYCAGSFVQHALHAIQNGRWQVADSLARLAFQLSPENPALAGFRLQQKKMGR